MNELIEMLTSRLGVEEGQAKQGAGLLFSKAKEQLGESDFAKLASHVPGIDTLLGEAPEAEAAQAGGLMGMLGGAAEKFGLGGVGSIADIAAGFSKIGIPTDKLTDFASVVLEFIEKQGGTDARAMIEKFLKP